MREKVNLLFKITGNPFVDIGIFVLGELSDKKIDQITIDDVIKACELLPDVYFSENWKRGLYIVFPNSPITHQKTGNPENYKKFLNDLISDLQPPGNFGDCSICGSRNRSKIKKPKAIGKHLIPLTGSEDLINFFPNAKNEISVCSNCLLAVQFMPIALYDCRGNFILMHSNSEKVMRSWVKSAVRNFRLQISTGNFAGFYSKDVRNPVNALFKNTEELILNYDELWLDENPAIRVYFFSNHNQNPNLDIYDLPSKVFRFLVYVKMLDSYDNWQKIVARGYKKDINSYNQIYQNLLEDISILRYFFDISERRSFAKWELIKYYLKEVREMDEKRINAIKNLADKISEFIKLTDNDKRLGQLERCERYDEFRNILRLIYKDWIRLKGEPLFGLDEYLKDLLPEGALGWSEVRDLILFRIYENLSDWLKEKEISEEKINGGK